MEKIKEIDGNDLDNFLLSDLVVEGYYDYFEITNCIINKCDFSKSNLQGIDISDTKISFSNFSNVDLSSRSYKKSKKRIKSRSRQIKRKRNYSKTCSNNGWK